MGSGTFNVLDRCCFYKHTKERKWKGRDFYEYICHICYICFVCPYVLRYLGLSGVLQFVWLIEPKKWLGPQEALESRFSHLFIPIDVSRCYVSSSRCPIYHLPSNQVIIVLKYLLFISQRFVSKPRSPFITAKHWEEVAGDVGCVFPSVSLLGLLVHGQLQCLWSISSFGGNHPCKESQFLQANFLSLLRTMRPTGPLRTSESHHLLNRKLEEFLQSLCNLVSSFYKSSKSYPLAGCEDEQSCPLARYPSLWVQSNRPGSFVGLGIR